MTPNGYALRAIREQRGLTLRRFADLIERDPGYWSRVETGQQGAGAATLHRAASVLEVPIEAIVMEAPRDQELPGQHPH
ncbi:helix-turn-helix domain-containing protein [Actinacidiphila glaucinigra]|uniref:helix-turn-helix domain-containing protein n=1 Tax=Actinacidiphila glaucinigra TaxID=235986 RepID=UPI00386B37DF